MKIALFAGTSEGKAVAALLADQGHQVIVTVATDYGREVFFDSLYQAQGHREAITILDGRLNAEGMRSLTGQADLVLDATHPYAVEVSKNIIAACKATGRDYVRIIRDDQDMTRGFDVLRVKDQQEALEVMDQIQGRILLTTGSKDLPFYAQARDHADRLYPRILPDMASLEIAEKAGYKKSHTICMQGPFTAEVNAAMLQMIGASYLLTKDTGKSGGFLEKLQGCQKAGARAIVIERPREELEAHDDAEIQLVSLTVKELEDFLRVFKARRAAAFTVMDLRAYKVWLKGERDKEYLRFPLFVDLKDRLAVVIGSGAIAQRRIRTLLDYGARVKIISPAAFAELPPKMLQESRKVSIAERPWQAGDLDGAFLALAATGDREVNRAVAQEAGELGIFASIADCKEESSFYFPATWKSERLSLGMVGDGKDHAYLKKMADKIKEILNQADLEDKDEEN